MAAGLCRRQQQECREWERLHFTGLGARATADMAGKRPLRALGPMEAALILRILPIKEKERK